MSISCTQRSILDLALTSHNMLLVEQLAFTSPHHRTGLVTTPIRPCLVDHASLIKLIYARFVFVANAFKLPR
jgi:hypothetical protein